MFYRACVLSTEGVFISLALYLPHPLQGSVTHLNIKATVDNGETLESTKKPPAGFKGQEGEERSDSGKELSPYMQLNKATVRRGRALIHKHTKTAGGIHTWEWWEEKRKTYSIIRYNREKETCASDARLHLGSHRTVTGKFTVNPYGS